MRKFIAVIILLFATMATAQDKPVQQPKPTPLISAELKARFWKAQTEAYAAQLRLQQAQAKAQAMMEQLTLVCGGQPTMDQDGDPVCPVPPVESKK